MLKPEQIPDEAWRIAADVLGDLNVYETEMREAIASALNRWPGVEHQTPNGWSNKHHIILPLPQETNDE